MQKDIRRLPDSELEVMQAVWRCEAPATRKEIEKNLNREPPMAATTLLTLLSRLAERGFLRIQKEDEHTTAYGNGSIHRYRRSPFCYKLPEKAPDTEYFGTVDRRPGAGGKVLFPLWF